MGKEDIKQVGGTNGEPKTTGGETTGSGSPTSTTSTRGRGGRGDSTTTTGRGAEPATEKETKSPKLVTVDVPSSPEDKEAEKKRKRAEYEKARRAKAKEEKEQMKASVKKTPNTPLDTSQIDIVLMTVSNIVATRSGLEHWALSPQEISQITTPLSNMISKSEVFQNMGEHSDQIALCIACFTIIVPRLMVTLTRRKEGKRIEPSTPIRTTPEPHRGSGENHQGSGGNDRKATTSSKGDSQSIFSIIPPTAI